MPFYTSLKTLLPTKALLPLQKQLPRTLPWAVAAVFLLLIDWQLLPLLGEPRSDTAAIDNSANQVSNDPRLQKIINSEIFGVAMESDDETGETVAASDQALQVTNLPYVLKGIISAATPEKGSAIIELSPGDSSYFSAGREISSNITLLAVHRDHVIISNQGRKETLRLAELSLSMAAPAKPSSSFTNTDSMSGSSSDATTPAPPADEPNNATENNNQDPEDMIKRDRIRQRLEELRARNPS